MNAQKQPITGIFSVLSRMPRLHNTMSLLMGFLSEIALFTVETTEKTLVLLSKQSCFVVCERFYAVLQLSSTFFLKNTYKKIKTPVEGIILAFNFKDRYIRGE